MPLQDRRKAIRAAIAEGQDVVVAGAVLGTPALLTGLNPAEPEALRTVAGEGPPRDDLLIVLPLEWEATRALRTDVS